MTAILAAGASDTGRRRVRNEDAFVCKPPLFVVADGMGGARGGELAARLAVEVFEVVPETAALDPGARLRALILEANRRVYERAAADPGLAGMGTTLTAAVLGGDRVAIAHVGDSRAYRLRAGVLEQLTDDHSLVAELVRSGNLTPEEAEFHPQRSVITRAVGTDATVLADVLLAEARPGDVFVLCTDGLTSMVDASTIARIVEAGGVGEGTARALVAAANDAGGDDNVTVVLFGVGGEPPSDEPSSEERTVLGLETEPSTDDHTLVAIPVETVPLDRPPRREPSGLARRVVVLGALVLAVLGVTAAAAVIGIRRAHFVGATEDGRVAVYEGVPWDITDGIRLYREIYVSPLRAVQLTQGERAELFDHELLSEEAARARLLSFEREIAIP